MPIEMRSLQKVIERIVDDCKWYYGYLEMRFLEKDLHFMSVTDPITFDRLDDTVRNVGGPKPIKYYRYRNVL